MNYVIAHLCIRFCKILRIRTFFIEIFIFIFPWIFIHAWVFAKFIDWFIHRAWHLPRILQKRLIYIHFDLIIDISVNRINLLIEDNLMNCAQFIPNMFPANWFVITKLTVCRKWKFLFRGVVFGYWSYHKKIIR